METLEAAWEYDHALVVGIGGSGDVVGAIPTARLLEAHGVRVTLGGIAWEPVPEDPVLGPRPLDEFVGLDRLHESVGLVTGETRTVDGIAYSEAHVAGFYDEPVVLVDITAGVDGMIAGLDAACEALGVDLVVGTDSGGDVLARGGESGLRSPITDGLGLVALCSISADAVLGVFGYGADGELTIPELEEGIARAAARNGLLGAWGITPRVRAELEGVLERVSTEASRLPVEAARGAVGERWIRGGTVSLHLSPASTVTFYFTPESVRETSENARIVAEHRELNAITRAFEAAGWETEFDQEAARLEQAD